MFIVAVKDEAGRLTTGTRPKVHPNKELAMEEAKKLSQSTPGTDYVVFGATDIVVTKAVYTAEVTQVN